MASLCKSENGSLLPADKVAYDLTGTPCLSGLEPSCALLWVDIPHLSAQGWIRRSISLSLLNVLNQDIAVLLDGFLEPQSSASQTCDQETTCLQYRLLESIPDLPNQNFEGSEIWIFKSFIGGNVHIKFGKFCLEHLFIWDLLPNFLQDMQE